MLLSDSKQCSLFQLCSCLMQGFSYDASDCVRVYVSNTELYDTGLVATSGGEDSAEIKIMRQHRVAMLTSVIHNRGIGRIGRTKCGPVV